MPSRSRARNPFTYSFKLSLVNSRRKRSRQKSSAVAGPATRVIVLGAHRHALRPVAFVLPLQTTADRTHTAEHAIPVQGVHGLPGRSGGGTHVDLVEDVRPTRIPVARGPLKVHDETSILKLERPIGRHQHATTEVVGARVDH